MRAVRCAVNFNEILQTEAGLEEMWAESRDTVNEKNVHLRVQSSLECGSNGDGADLLNLGIIPTKQQLPTNRPRDPQRTRYSSFPREPPNQTVWMTAGLLLSTMPTRRKQKGSSRLLAHSFLMYLYT